MMAFIVLMIPFFPREERFFTLKDCASKGMDFADDPLLMECFLHLPPLPFQDTNPMDYQLIFTKQNKTDDWLQWKQNFLTAISVKSFMIMNSFAMLRLMMIATCRGKLP